MYSLGINWEGKSRGQLITKFQSDSPGSAMFRFYVILWAERKNVNKTVCARVHVGLNSHPPKPSSANAWMSGHFSISIGSNCTTRWTAESQKHNANKTFTVTQALTNTLHCTCNRKTNQRDSEVNVLDFGLANQGFYRTHASHWSHLNLCQRAMHTTLKAHFGEQQDKRNRTRRTNSHFHNSQKPPQSPPLPLLLSLSLRFNIHFLGGPGLVGTRMSPFWILLEVRVIDVLVTTRAISRAPVTINKPTASFFYRPDVLPVAQPTVSKHWREKAMQYLQRFYHCRFNIISLLTTPTNQHQVIFTGWMSFLTTNLQCQSTEGKPSITTTVGFCVTCLIFQRSFLVRPGSPNISEKWAFEDCCLLVQDIHRLDVLPVTHQQYQKHQRNL